MQDDKMTYKDAVNKVHDYRIKLESKLSITTEDEIRIKLINGIYIVNEILFELTGVPYQK